MFEVVLICPEIPQNTGNIGRLCVGAGARLHLVMPIGFSLNEKYIRRAGLDYWQHLDLTIHESVDKFLVFAEDKSCMFFSTKGERSYLDTGYPPKTLLVFGNESCGFPQFFYVQFKDRLFTIPMPGEFARSLNVANVAAVVLYHAIATSL
ncbi:MAG: tRNA (cytidine(34)-2'-O)-methyltransferase [Victivallales bacterium]|nr:tRNA (cytidine(34)-2'-O)-methyltransferase [Victivallales bacterium]